MQHSLVDLVTRAVDRYYRCHSIVGGVPTNHKEKHHVETYKKAGLICAAAVTAAVLSAVPISVERSAKSDIVVSVSQAQAYYGHYRRVTRRVYRRAVRRCAYGVTCY